MAGAEKRKVLLNLPEDMSEEITTEGIRLDRPRSWVVLLAWRLAREHVRKFRAPDTTRTITDEVTVRGRAA